MKTYDIDEVKKIVKDQGYFYCSLVDDRSKYIVPWNKSTDKTGALKKMDEIKKRLEVLPDGVYCIECKNSFNKKVHPDSFTVLKGNIDTTKIAELRAVQPFNENGTGNGNKVMTYSEALKLTQENARLTAELASAKKELADANADYDELEADYNEATKEGALAEATPPAKGWTEAITPLIPVVDRLAGLFEKKLDLDERRLEQGAGQSRRRSSAPKKEQTNGRQIPAPGTPQFETYLDQLDGLSDEQFLAECNYLAKFHPDIYVHVYNEFKEEPQEQAKEN